MFKKGNYTDATLPPRAKIVYLGDLVTNDRYTDLFVEFNKSDDTEDADTLEDAMFNIWYVKGGKLYDMGIGKQLKPFLIEQRITFVRMLLPDAVNYTKFNADYLVVQFSSSPVLWTIGGILGESLSALDSPPGVGYQYAKFWSSHWIVGHMRFLLLRTAVEDKERTIFDTMNEVWTGSGYTMFYERQTPTTLLYQQEQAKALAALIYKVSPVATSEYVDVFHIVNSKRPGLRSTYTPSPAQLKSTTTKAPLNWHELHAFACVQYGAYTAGDTNMPVVCLRLHQSVASAATFRNEQAVFVVLIDTVCKVEDIDTALPAHCKRCKTECVFKGDDKTITFESRTSRDTQLQLRSKDNVPKNLLHYIAVCTKCSYAHGCPTYTFKAK